ncbi:uncharacterized protein HaLaN_25193 [Haematococcus lacustris]|uniref:Cyclic nucleotide-binding domain-containing protein n=1 Tax=Haematococcus lacustris TaxID=44745 RepID=A0A699ZY65_HAELA|nr:uncharacterized protein HaLaN_25193 [Haematococcus lacustris]
MDNQSQRMLVQNMYKRHVTAGEILIGQGSTGLAATQLYVIESGSFEILQKRQGYTVRVDLDHPGRCLGEISLYYDWARDAAIVAKSRAVVWYIARQASDDSAEMNTHLDPFLQIHHPDESNGFSTSAITAQHHVGVSNQPRDQIGSSDCEAPSEFGRSTLPSGRDVFQSRWALSMR